MVCNRRIAVWVMQKCSPDGAIYLRLGILSCRCYCIGKRSRTKTPKEQPYNRLKKALFLHYLLQENGSFGNCWRNTRLETQNLMSIWDFCCLFLVPLTGTRRLYGNCGWIHFQPIFSPWWHPCPKTRIWTKQLSLSTTFSHVSKARLTPWSPKYRAVSPYVHT